MKIDRMNKGNWGKVRAFFDLTTSEGLTVKGFKIIEGINGLFVSMPSQKSNDGEYYDSVFASKELRDQIKKLCYDKKYLTACLYCNGRDYSSVNIPSALQVKKPLGYKLTDDL